MARIIEVVPYDPSWPDIYHAEVARVASVVGDNLVAAHHVGSTAVPGLAAKPTIDILLVVDELNALDACNTCMLALGYQPKGERGIAGRRYFSKAHNDVHLFHIHAFQQGHPEIDRHLNFRDYLIAHPGTAKDYQALKEQLAVKFRDTPPQYTTGKTDFILTVDGLAATWRGGLDRVGDK